LKQLREAIRIGDEAMERGDYITINSNQELDDFFAKL